MIIQNYLLDKNFLKKLFNQKNKHLFIKILSLDFFENVQEEIQGRVLPGGNINIDGSSSIRRTCNLNFITNKLDIHTFYWAQNSKFKLELGVSNLIDSNYEDIIWFNQGIFIITSFNQNLNINNQNTISISGKDKMALLNGEAGGVFTTATEFAFELFQNQKDNTTTKNFLLLKDIILNLIHIFGKEPLQNIIVNDLEDIGLETQAYNGDNPLYLFKEVETTIFSSKYSIDGNEVCWLLDKNNNLYQTSLNDPDIVPLVATSIYSNETQASKIFLENNRNAKQYFLIKIQKGELAGYKYTKLTFPGGTLEGKAGETITSVLDKIINVFNDFEYFYNIDGRFIFQKKKNYINSTYDINKDKFNLSLFNNSEIAYDFDNSEAFINFSITPNLLNIKNDFSIWGTKESLDGLKKDLHIRYALDIKPTYYKRTDTGMEFQIGPNCDWREILYQMADDYYSNSSKKQIFYSALVKNNPNFINGITGYEQYYADILEFWRQVYEENGEFKKDILSNPDKVLFWLDFIDGDSTLKSCSVKNIGSRTQVVNDNKLNTLLDWDTMPIIFKTIDEEEYSFFQGKYIFITLENENEIPLKIYPTKKTAKSTLDNLLTKNLTLSQVVTITSLPIYILEPNTIISITDNNNNINNNFIVNKILLPLGYDGQMTITAIQN